MKGPAPPRRAAVVLAVLAIVPPAAAAPALVRLAEGFAAEVVRVARGRPVEVTVPEDRTGRRASLALDLHALVLDRLQGRAIIRGSGARLRVRPVLSQTPGGLVLSARVLEEPGGNLVDLVSVSAPTDESVFALSPVPAPAAAAGPAAIDVRSTGRTPPLEEPVLDLAFFGDERLVVLGPDAVALYKWDEAELTLESRRPWPGPLGPVRSPGGLLRMAEKDAAFWALTSRSPRALLFAVEEGGLVERQEADALPWPASPAGLRYRAGTNLIEGVLPGLGPGPFLGVDDSVPGLAVSAEGVLLDGASKGPAVGPAMAALWPGVLAAASPRPPGEDDAILIVAARDGSGDAPRVLDSIRVDGAVRALAARARGESMRLVAAVEDEEGGARLLVMDLARVNP
jgi:hypothetical protein